MESHFQYVRYKYLLKVRIDGIESFLSRFHIDRLSVVISLRAASSVTDSLTFFITTYTVKEVLTRQHFFLVSMQILFARESFTAYRKVHSQVVALFEIVDCALNIGYVSLTSFIRVYRPVLYLDVVRRGLYNIEQYLMSHFQT